MNKPTKLGNAGTRLWNEVTKSYDLRVDEMRLLAEACRTLDEIALMERALASQEMTVAGSMGQVRANPLLAELRGHRTLLAKITRQLGLPDLDGDGRVQQREGKSERHVKAAQARWADRALRPAKEA